MPPALTAEPVVVLCSQVASLGLPDHLSDGMSAISEVPVLWSQVGSHLDPVEGDVVVHLDLIDVGRVDKLGETRQE